jgi:hypothetical protein
MLAAALFSSLLACGGGGSGGGGGSSGGGGSPGEPPPSSDDIVVSSVVVNSATVAPISRSFDAAGKYELTVTGAFTAGTVSAPDNLALRFSISGQGLVTGNAQSSFAITKTAQEIPLSQTITFDATGAGPWSIQIQLATQAIAGTASDLRLHVVKGS